MIRRNSLTQGEVLGFVRRWLDTFRSEAEAARAVGITRQSLNEMTNGDRPFTDKVLGAAGVKVVRPAPEYYPMEGV